MFNYHLSKSKIYYNYLNYSTINRFSIKIILEYNRGIRRLELMNSNAVCILNFKNTTGIFGVETKDNFTH